jgi:hypothetical protein
MSFLLFYVITIYVNLEFAFPPRYSSAPANMELFLKKSDSPVLLRALQCARKHDR